MDGVKRYLPHFVVFVSSMGVMIIELIASRLVSKYFGSSLYTWTGIIGVVLGGISLGNYVGGRLADRFSPRNIIGLLLLIASFLTFLVLVLDLLLFRIMNRGAFTPATAAMVIRSLALILVLFFLPSTALGTVSPVMAKYALEQSSRVGNTVGSIYAVSAIGSIVGTFLSGYVLIPLLGITTVVLVVGTLLALLALLMGRLRAVSLSWVLVVAAALLVFRASGPAG
ncbi:MAG: fused MFS/spermidine synthase, partial [Spirochaetales bacterium]|nr:fused MFS/spermidine synthase [Spirochaetales bacterium]